MTQSNLVDHANREMDLIGWPKPTRAQIRGDLSAYKEGTDEKWNLMMRISVIRIVEVFASQGHSGGSAQQAMFMINQVLQYKPLSSITDDPEYWHHLDPAMTGGIDMWQCKRNPEAFSHDGGKTYYFVGHYSKRGKLFRRIPSGKLHSWVWKHRSWVHPIHTSKLSDV